MHYLSKKYVLNGIVFENKWIGEINLAIRANVTKWKFPINRDITDSTITALIVDIHRQQL